MQLPEFLIFSLEIFIILLLTSKLFLLVKTGCSLIDFDVIFPMQSSKFLKPLNFGSIWEKTAKTYNFV